MSYYYIVLINYKDCSYSLIGIYDNEQRFEEAHDSLILEEWEKLDTGVLDSNVTYDLAELRAHGTSCIRG